MRIAVLTNAFPPEAKGGAGVIAADLAALWGVSGHDVRIWSSSSSWLRKGVLRRLLGHLFDDRSPAPAVSEILAWCPELFVTHNLTGCGWSSGRALQRAGTRWVHILHDVQLFEPSGQMFADRVTWWQRIWSWYRRRLFCNPDLVVSPTKWLIDAHRQRGWFAHAPVQVVPNPAPAPAQITTMNAERRGWLFVATALTPAKGMDMVLDLAWRLPDEEFVCIGTYTEAIGERVPPNVQFMGPAARETVQTYMRQVHGVLVPSRIADNQPTVILEAFAQGTPVIGSPVGGIPETVGKGGRVCDLDLEKWQEAMAACISEWHKWSEGALVEGHLHSPERVRQLWEGVFAAGGTENS